MSATADRVREVRELWACYAADHLLLSDKEEWNRASTEDRRKALIATAAKLNRSERRALRIYGPIKAGRS